MYMYIHPSIHPLHIHTYAHTCVRIYTLNLISSLCHFEDQTGLPEAEVLCRHVAIQENVDSCTNQRANKKTKFHMGKGRSWNLSLPSSSFSPSPPLPPSFPLLPEFTIVTATEVFKLK